MNDPKLPPMVGTLSTLPEHVQEVVKSYARAAIAINRRAAVTPSAPQQAEGWVMVPVEPTSNMLAAMSGEWHPSRHDTARKQYAAMIAARPSAPSAVEPDDQRYQLLRRGQHWSVIDGVGDVLRGDDLDAAVDSILAARLAKDTP